MVQGTMANRTLELRISVALLLRPLLDALVFDGGCTTALLITDPAAAAEVRSTYDVDSIAAITSYAEYAAFSERLRQLSFAEDYSERSADLPMGAWRFALRCHAPLMRKLSLFLFSLFRAWYLRREPASSLRWLTRAIGILLGIATTRPVMGIFFASSATHLTPPH
jgi:hypothetical protein